MTETVPMQPSSAPANRKLDLVRAALEDRKGRDIRCIDVRRLTEITDYMVVATGTSNTHIKALSDSLIAKCKAAGLPLLGVEGRRYADWVLVDAGDVVVHIMSAPARQMYRLEDLWYSEPQEPSDA